MAPTTCMNVAALRGTIFVARGLRYMLQSVSTLKNLSMPAMIGPRPRPSFRAHHATLRRSESGICPSAEKSREKATGYTMGASFVALSEKVGCNIVGCNLLTGFELYL
jgi:hypothetical protein